MILHAKKVKIEYAEQDRQTERGVRNEVPKFV